MSEVDGRAVDASEGDIKSEGLVLSYIDDQGVAQVIQQNDDGSYTIPAGVVALTISIPSVADEPFEGEEIFDLTASVVTDGYDAAATGRGTIIDQAVEPEPSRA